MSEILKSVSNTLGSFCTMLLAIEMCYILKQLDRIENKLNGKGE